MYLSVQPDLEHWVRGENEEIWGLALLLSQTNVGSSAHCLFLSRAPSLWHTHTHKEKRCNWLSMIRLFLDPRTLPLIKILICGTILEAVDWYIMHNICLSPVSCSDTQTDTWYLRKRPPTPTHASLVMGEKEHHASAAGFWVCSLQVHLFLKAFTGSKCICYQRYWNWWMRKQITGQNIAKGKQLLVTQKDHRLTIPAFIIKWI